MTLQIGTEIFKNVKNFYTEYQKNNGRSHWVFITEKDGHNYAVNYDPKKERIIFGK